ncbi:acyltransferase [Cellvibrio sp. UBA7661]|uniref:acyltransferase family protein n=1 Tax=Cellvibrio sp. UBA7661 TaxID=1946311 RepID=UPI002F354AC3
MQPAHSSALSLDSARYIHSLTPLRGLAALWVVVFHIDVSLYYRDLGALLPRTSTGIFSQGYLWVDFFFLLSGFIIAHVYGERLQSSNKPHAIKEYLWARFARIYPLHLFTLALLVLIAPVVAYYFPAVVDGSWKTYFAWSAIPSHLLFTNAMNQHEYLSWNMVSWSIGAEWWTYIAALGLIIGLWKKSLPIVVIAMSAAFLCLAGLVYWLPEKKLDITFNYGFWRCLFEFIIGLGIYQFYVRNCVHRWLKRDIVFAALLLGIAATFHFKWPDLIVIPLFALLILSAAYNNNVFFTLLQKPLLQYLGTISYSIYLMHGLWFFVFWFSFPFVKVEYELEQMPLLAKCGYILIFIALTLGSAHFSYRYIEVPGRRWFNPRCLWAKNNP